MVRTYVRKTAAVAPGAAEEAIKTFFQERALKPCGALKRAALGRVKEPTLCGWLKGHDDVDSALAAYRARAPRGGQTVLSPQVEQALATLIYQMWQRGLTCTSDQVIAMATEEAFRAGTPCTVRAQRTHAHSCHFGVLRCVRCARV